MTGILTPKKYNENGLKQENFVHLDGNEEIDGIKMFLQSILTPTPASADNSTKAATTAFVKTLLTAYAKLASPAFSGAPTAPTPASEDNSTKIATTAFVNGKLISGLYYSLGTNFLELFTSSAKTTRVLLFQWGRYSTSYTRDIRATITFSKAYISTPTVLVTGFDNGSGDLEVSSSGVRQTNNTSFVARVYGHGSGDTPYGFNWFAIGK